MIPVYCITVTLSLWITFSHWNTARTGCLFSLTYANAASVERLAYSTNCEINIVFRFWEISLSFWTVGFLCLLFGLMDTELWGGGCLCFKKLCVNKQVSGLQLSAPVARYVATNSLTVYDTIQCGFTLLICVFRLLDECMFDIVCKQAFCPLT